MRCEQQFTTQRGDVRVENVPDPVIKQPSDAIVRITHACICGSDLWFYRGLDNWQSGWRIGHEWMGVLAPFAFSDGSCEFCGKGLQTSCKEGGFWGGKTTADIQQWITGK